MTRAVLGAAALALLSGVAGCSNQPQVAGGTGFVQWIGLDARPLAVGSVLPVTLAIATDAGAAPAYTVSSSDPAVVDVEDAGEERILLSVVGAGTATLQLHTLDQRAELPVTAANPAGLAVWDAEHFAAGVGGPLDGGAFDVLSDSEEVLQAVVLDTGGHELNSWGLVTASSSTLLSSKREPEQLILAQGSNPSATLKVGLVGDGEQSDGGELADDGGAASALSYQIDFVTPTSVRLLRGGPSNLNVVAQAFFADGGIEVFGIDDWQFECLPPASCTLDRLSPSAVNLRVQPGSGGHDVTASSASQALQGMLVVP